MPKKYRATGCTRILIVLIILVPLAYIGASYMNGKDPIADVKDLFNRQSTPATTYKDDKDRTIKKLEKDVQFFEKENERLKEELDACQKANAGNQ